mgnify:CR=1 FL=1
MKRSVTRKLMMIMDVELDGCSLDIIGFTDINGTLGDGIDALKSQEISNYVLHILID